MYIYPQIHDILVITRGQGEAEEQGCHTSDASFVQQRAMVSVYVNYISKLPLSLTVYSFDFI